MSAGNGNSEFDSEKGRFPDGRTNIKGYKLHPKIRPFMIAGFIIFAFVSGLMLFIEIPGFIKTIVGTWLVINFALLSIPDLYIWEIIDQQ